MAMQPDRAKVPLIGSDEVLQLIPRMFAQRIQQKCFTRCRNDVIDRVPRGREPSVREGLTRINVDWSGSWQAARPGNWLGRSPATKAALGR